MNRRHPTTRSLTRARLRLRPFEERVVPAVFTVNDPGDVGNGSGLVGDLRYALNLANGNGEADTINLTFAGATTITLALGELFVTEALPLTIQGTSGGGAVTINANKLSRVFNVNTASPVTLANMTITGGQTSDSLGGGGIRLAAADGDLTLDRVVVANNATAPTPARSGGGIYVESGGTLRLTDSTVSGNTATRRGGGIYFYDAGSLLIERSSLINNRTTGSVRGGGAIYFYGATGASGVNIINSTISGNSTSGVGGGITFFNSKGDFNIRNSTITNNTAGGITGGGVAMFSYLTTAAGNLNVTSTIIAGNTNLSSRDIGVKSQAAIPSLDSVTLNNCLVGAANTFTFAGTGNLTGTQAAPLDAKLGPLADNGGPTQTHLPLSGSPVRNAGSNIAPALAVDQRGQPRVQGGLPDIGSVESEDPRPGGVLTAPTVIATPGATPDTVVITYSGTAGVQVSSIDANDITITGPTGLPVPVTAGSGVAGPGGTAVGTYTFTIPGGAWDAIDSGVYTVNLVANQVFDASGTNGNDAATVGSFEVAIATTLIVDATNDETTDTDGKTSLREALAFANRSFSLDTITFDPTVFATPQTIKLALGEMLVSRPVNIVGPAARATLDANKASRVMNISVPNIGNSVAISNLGFTNGQVTGLATSIANRGAGIFIEDENVTLTNVLVSNNTSTGTGGGIYSRGNPFPTDPGSLTIVDSVVQNNASIGDTNLGFRVGSGGGISIDLAGKMTMQRTTVTGNSVTGSGGGVYFVASGTLDMSQSLLSGNTAAGTFGGGGLYFYGTVVGGMRVANTTISGNVATNGRGGGIALQDFNGASKLNLVNSTIANNTATIGGGISRAAGSSTAPLNMISTIVANNVATIQEPDISIPDVIESQSSLVSVADSVLFSVTSLNNLVGDSVTPLDPLLGPLANNGGPTLTHALLPGSPAIDAGINSVPALTSDQRAGLFVRTFDQPGVPNTNGSDGTDIGAFELQPTPTPAAKVSSVVINNGAAQRSRVTSIRVNFDQVVSFVDISKAFSLTRVSDSASVTLNPVLDGSGTFVTITFTGGAIDGANPLRSLADGRYTLVAFAGQFAGGGLDGDGNGTAGDDFTLNSTPYGGLGTPATGVFRLFGDANGNGQVGIDDFLAFRLSFLSGNDAFDNDGNGSVDASDFLKFRLNFLAQIV